MKNVEDFIARYPASRARVRYYETPMVSCVSLLGLRPEHLFFFYYVRIMPAPQTRG